MTPDKTVDMPIPNIIPPPKADDVVFVCSKYPKNYIEPLKGSIHEGKYHHGHRPYGAPIAPLMLCNGKVHAYIEADLVDGLLILANELASVADSIKPLGKTDNSILSDLEKLLETAKQGVN